MKAWMFVEKFFGENDLDRVVMGGVEYICVSAKDISFSFGNDSKYRFWKKGEEIDIPDYFVIVDYVDETFPAAAVLESIGVVNVTGSEGVRIAASKVHTYIKLVKEGLPCAKTIVLRKGIKIPEILKELSYPMVAKPDSGYGGDGVRLVHGDDELMSLLSKVNDEGADVILQEFISSSKGRDLRIVVAGNEVAFGYERVADDPDEFRSNVHTGGSVRPVEITDELVDLSLKASKCVGLHFCSVDYLYGEDGFVIGELNSFPGVSKEMMDQKVVPAILRYVDEVKKR